MNYKELETEVLDILIRKICQKKMARCDDSKESDEEITRLVNDPKIRRELIEEHVRERIRTLDKRGTNPRSLKNLKQNRQ